VLPVASTLDYASIKAQCDASGIDIILTQDNLYDVIANCDTIVSCSGTVTLEIALLGVPMCIIYKMSWLSWQIMSRLVTIEHIGLANIVAARPVVRELLQDVATPGNISQELSRLLDDEDYRKKVKAGLDEVKQNLGEGNGSQRMAELVLSCLQDSCPEKTPD
jgi:lipid-A-disaccharide synthase